MSFIAFGGEKRLADLVTRAYGKLKAADAKRAAAALLAANPRLEDIGRVERGRPITVPAIPGLAKQQGAAESAPLAQGLEGLRASVARFADQLSEGDKLEKRDLDLTRSLMGSDDLRSIAADHPGALELLERIAKSTDERTADLARRASFVKELRKAEKELAELTRTLD